MTAAIRPMPPPMHAASSRNPRPTFIMGSSTTPPSVAVSQCRQRGRHSAFRPGAVFRSRRSAPNGRSTCRRPVPIMGKVLYGHMKAHNIKTVGYIGYSDSYGDLLVQRFQDPGRADGHDPRRRGAFRAAGYVGHRAGAEARRRQSRTRSWSALPARRPACRSPSCAIAATRA